MKRRVIYRVTWTKGQHWRLHITGHVPGRVLLTTTWDKHDIVKTGRRLGRKYWEDGLGLAQLVVHNKNGRICFEATYGRDPKRYKS